MVIIVCWCMLFVVVGCVVKLRWLFLLSEDRIVVVVLASIICFAGGSEEGELRAGEVEFEAK